MDLEKLTRLVSNFEKRRLNLLRIPEAQKKVIRPDYERSKKDLEDEINSIIDERIKLRIVSNAEADPVDEPIEGIDYTIDSGTDDKGSQDDSGTPDNDNQAASAASPDDDKPPELF